MSQLALQLIAKEKKEKTGYLELGRCGLTPDNPRLEEVWETLGELVHLETLIFSNKWWDWEKGIWINSKNEGVDNRLSQIPSCVIDLSGLKKLIIAGTYEIDSGWQITNLKNIDTLSNLQYLDISYNQIRTLESFSKLSNLQHLDIGENQIRTLKDLGQLSNLQNFYVTDNQITKLEGLNQLSNLQQFNIRDNQISKLEGLDQLSNLQKFNIRNNQITKLEGLDQLSNLQQFDIDNNQITKLEGLDQLSNLQQFGINNNQITKLEGLDQLSNLQQFDIDNNQITKLEGLDQLSNLQQFGINNNQITKLEGLDQLSKLQQFGINNNQITKLEGLDQLSKLQQFGINNNQITKLEGLDQLSKLQQFGINNNQITKLEGLDQLSNLQQFDINNNQITKLEGLECLSPLKRLNISNTAISDLRPMKDWVLKGIDIKWDWGLEGICVESCPLIIPPKEVVQEGNDAVLRYFQELEKEKGIQVREAKLILSGSGEVGKTSLRVRLNDRNGDLPKMDERTKEIAVESYTFSSHRQDQDFVAHIWDFGGQQIVHHFHRFFMNDSALYILMTETSRQDDDLDYWLQTIQLYGKESPILFVQNKRNGLARSLDIAPYKAYFNIKEGVFNVNLLDNEGLDTLEKAIQYYIQNLPHTQRTIPKSWLRVREKLEKIQETRSFISYERFREVCEVENITTRLGVQDVGQFLHRLGVLLWYHENPVLQQKIILERHWATEGIFKLVFDENIQNTGHFTLQQAQAIWDKEEKYSHHANELIAMMHEFKVCFPRKNEPSAYIIPALLPPTAPEDIWEYPQRMTIEYRYDTILPRGLVNYLTAELYDFIEEDAHAWGAGVWLTVPNAQAKVVENRYHRYIHIQLGGEQYRELFGAIKKVMEDIHKDYAGMSPELMLPCVCEECRNTEDDQKGVFCYSDILRRLERRKDTIECNRSFEDVTVKALLDNVFPKRHEKAKAKEVVAKKIFISYSHEDIKYKSKLENTFAVQRRLGNVVLWNDQDIRAGENWHAKIMEQLEAADIFVLLLSSDFWVSDFVWEEELPIIKKRHATGNAQVVPILLRACDWEATEYIDFQAVPSKDGKLLPISQWENQDMAFNIALQRIKALL